jgi:hypothetical protein
MTPMPHSTTDNQLIQINRDTLSGGNFGYKVSHMLT